MALGSARFGKLPILEREGTPYGDLFPNMWLYLPTAQPTNFAGLPYGQHVFFIHMEFYRSSLGLYDEISPQIECNGDR